jgi:PKD repeat protein
MFTFASRRPLGAALMLLVAVLGACAPNETPTAPGSPTPGTPPRVPVAGGLPTEGYAVPGELRQGFVLDRVGRPFSLTYEVHDGKAIWQGDIVLGQANEISTTAAAARPYVRTAAAVRAAPGGPQPTIIIDGDNFRWPGGVLPYEIEAGLANQARITNAIKLIEETTGGVTIVPRSGEADYIKFVTAAGCSSVVGRQGGEQTVSVGTACLAPSLAHELLHALGMDHEQSRCDRDSYVEILFDHVQDGKAFNFDKLCDGYKDLGDIYDFGSLMHYSVNAFSKDGFATMQLRPGVTYSGVIGQREALSLLDAFTVNFLYGKFNKPPVPMIGPLAASYTEGTPVPFDATGSTDADDKVLTYRWNFGDDSCRVFPEPAECTAAKPNHVYAKDGGYKVGLFVWDGYEEEATETFVTITNGKPIVFITGGGPTTTEGSAFTATGFFQDPGDDAWSATVNYGDGGATVPLALTGSGNDFDLSHTYADNGSYTITVSVKDDDETGTNTRIVTVVNALPIVSAGADQTFTSGQTFTLAGTFSDDGVNDSPWNWSIDWGVGPATTGVKTSQGAIGASRRVCAAGTFNVLLTVTDKDGGVGSDAAQFTVGYVVVSVDITPSNTPNSVSLKNKGSLPVVILSSATFDARAIDIASVRLGNEVGVDTEAEKQKGKYVTRTDDINGDGRLDLIVSFSVPQLVASGDLTAATTSLVIRGFQGASDSCVNFRGSGPVRVVS